MDIWSHLAHTRPKAYTLDRAKMKMGHSMEYSIESVCGGSMRDIHDSVVGEAWRSKGLPLEVGASVEGELERFVGRGETPYTSLCELRFPRA